MLTVSGNDTLQGNFPRGLHVTGRGRVTLQGNVQGLLRVDRGSTLIVQGNTQAALATEAGSLVSLSGNVQIPFQSSAAGEVQVSGLLQIPPGADRMLPAGIILVMEGTLLQFLGLGGGIHRLEGTGELRRLVGQHVTNQVGGRWLRYDRPTNSFSPVR